MKKLLALVPALVYLAAPAMARSAESSLQSFQAAAQAPVFEITEDAANATFHPQGQGEFNYALSTMDGSATHAFSTFFWPGSAAGNLGALIDVASGGNHDYLNDPVRAEVNQGSNPPTQTNGSQGGPTMYASVQPEQTDAREARATTDAGAIDGTVFKIGASKSEAKIVLTGGTLKLSASSSASGIDLAGGAVHIGSFTASAESESKDGAAPKNTFTAPTVKDMTIGGQPAYIDGNGIHPGKPGQPADPAAATLLNTALQQAGMSIYLSAPHEVTVGGTNYAYAGSLVFYWAPPGDSGKDSFTMALGGAAVATTVTAGPGIVDDVVTDVGSAGTGDGGSASLAPIPTDTSPAVSLPVTPGKKVGAVGGPGGVVTSEPAAATLPDGLGGWVLVALLAGFAGIQGLTKIPTLLAKGPTTCPRENRPIEE